MSGTGGGGTAGADDRSRSTDELLRRAALAAVDALAVLRAVREDGRVVDFVFEFYNRAAAELIGRPVEEVVGHRVTELFPNAADHLVELWGETLELGEPVVEEIEATPGRRWLRQQIVPLDDALLVTSHDITDRRRVEAELEHRAFHDPLTDLPNRVLAVQRITESLGRSGDGGQRTAVVFMDVDRFKSVNDTLGHAAGDLLLQSLARRLRRCVRAADTVARISGDEFVVCLDGVATESDALAVVEKLLDAVRRPFLVADRRLVLTASLGVALDGPGLDADTLVSRADAAAYEAKRRGRNRSAVFDEHVQQRVLNEHLVEQELRAAITEGQLRLHFQPTVDLSRRRATGVEALVRWEHPTRGLLGPADFLRVAEEAGLMVDLGRWVRSAACGALARLLDHPATPRDIVMWVNVAATELTSGFCDEFAAAMALADVGPANLGVELTETALVGDDDPTGLVLDRLLAMGVRIAIDDFGAGSSSLNYLRRMRADVMKVHESFVHGLDRRAPGDPEATGAREVAAALISFGQRLGMTVVAEGVETPEQVAALTEMGCVHVAGSAVGTVTDEEGLVALLGELEVRGRAD